MWDDRVLTERHYVHNEPVPNYFLIIVLLHEVTAGVFTIPDCDTAGDATAPLFIPAHESSRRGCGDRGRGHQAWNGVCEHTGRGHEVIGNAGRGYYETDHNGYVRVLLPCPSFGVTSFSKNTQAI